MVVAAATAEAMAEEKVAMVEVGMVEAAMVEAADAEAVGAAVGVGIDELNRCEDSRIRCAIFAQHFA